MVSQRTGVVGAVCIAVSATLWGLDGVVLTPRLFNLDVGFVVAMLHLIPFALMQPFLFHEYRWARKFTTGDWLNFFLIALLGGAVGTLAIVQALFLVNFQHLSVVVLIQKLQPVFAILLARLLLHERPGAAFYGWAGLALVATYFTTFGLNLPDLSVAEGRNLVQAAGLAVLAAFSFGSATVFGKKALIKYRFYTTNFYRFGLTSLIMILYVSVMGKWGMLDKVTPENWFVFLVIALTTGGASLFLYYYGLKRVSASVGTICELFYPLSAILFDYLVYQSVLTPVQWLSAGVLFIAIVRIGVRNV